MSSVTRKFIIMFTVLKPICMLNNAWCVRSALTLICLLSTTMATSGNVTMYETMYEKLDFCSTFMNETDSSCRINSRVVSTTGSLCPCVEALLDDAIVSGTNLVPWSAEPQLLCRTLRSLTFTWKPPPGSFYLLISLEKSGEPCRHLTLTREQLLTISDLQPDTLYRVSTQLVLTDGLAERVLGSWISTLSEHSLLGDISNISLLDAEPQGDVLSARLQWEPAADRTCQYDVIVQHQLMSKILSVRKVEQLFLVPLSDLQYDSDYLVSVVGQLEEEDVALEGGRATHTVHTPSCLQMNNFSLQVCPPSQVENVTVSEVAVYTEDPVNIYDTYDVTVSWSKPVVVPDTVTVLLSLVSSDDLYHDNMIRTSVVAGWINYVTFEDVEIGPFYSVQVWGSSLAGDSQVTTIERRLALRELHTAQIQHMSEVGIFHFFIYVSAALLGVLFVAVITALYVVHRKKKERHKPMELMEIVLKPCAEETSREEPVLTVDEFEVDFKDLVLGEDVLGKGAFGVVRRGWLHSADSTVTDVAVKMLREKPRDEDLVLLEKEIDMLKMIGRHPNIVSLIGCCTSGRMLLLVEYCALGDLHTFLHKVHRTKNDPIAAAGKVVPLHRYENIAMVTVNRLYSIIGHEKTRVNTPNGGCNLLVSTADLVSIARQTATGMEFLSSNRIIHRDLAARNVLLCTDRTVKISDFGLSRDVYEENFYVKRGDGKLPIKWMALESLIYQTYTTQSDVWSFGILLWEIMTFGAVPYPGLSSSRLIQLLSNGYRSPKPDSCNYELYDIMLSCWRCIPTERPTFSQLKELLGEILQTAASTEYLHLLLANEVPIFTALGPSSSADSVVSRI